MFCATCASAAARSARWRRGTPFGPRGGAGGVEHHRPGLGIGARLPRRAPCDRSNQSRRTVAHRRRADSARLGSRAPPRPTRLRRSAPSPRRRAQKKSSSSAVARQFTGVMTMPANWQAQCRVAASQRFCSAVTMWSPGFRPSASRPATTRRDAPVPLRISEPHVAVDDRERVGIARDAGEEAGAEVKHRAASERSRHRARPRRSARSRCSGRCGRSRIRAAPPRRDRAPARRYQSSDIRMPAVQKPHCSA